MIFWCLLGSAIMILIFSTFVAWYEGSNIVDDPFEWKYTAKFTNYFKGEVVDYHEISQLDYFIYAAKFYPLFPSIMVASSCFIMILLMYKSGIIKIFINRLKKLIAN